MRAPIKLLHASIAVILLVMLGIAPASAQEDIDISFSSEKIDSYGFPELLVTFNGTEFEVPTEIEASYHVVVLTPSADTAVYVDFMQPAEGLSEDEMVDKALAAAAMDVVEPGWTFGGGSYAMQNTPTRFIVRLDPGEWQIAASWQLDEDGAEETMTRNPLTVAESGVSTSGEMDPEPDVIMELNDVEFGGLDASVSTGPILFEVRNVGEQPRQMVLFRTDRALTSDDYAGWFASMGSGTPAPPPFEMTWVGYAALTSPGFSTWIELDLEPGTYTATSWVVDPETGAPALLLGMVQSFEVE